MIPHTDIRAQGWVALLPQAAQPYALLARLDRPIGAWLLFLPGAWGILLGHAPVAETARLLLLFALGSVVMRSAGCIVNDWWDRDIDRHVARTAARPLASGALRARHAAALLAVLLTVGLLILLRLNTPARLLGASSLILVAFYPLAKRYTWWPQLVMGITFGVGAPIGYAAATGRIDAPLGLVYAATILWDLGFDTIYAHQDREDDAVVGVRSTARLLGRSTAPFVALCYLLMLALLALAGLQAGLDGRMLLPALIPGAVLLLRQVWQLDINNPAACLAAFRANRGVGLALCGALLAGWW